MEHRGTEHVLEFESGDKIVAFLVQQDGEAEPRIVLRKSAPKVKMTPDEAQSFARLIADLTAQGGKQPEGWPFTEES